MNPSLYTSGTRFYSPRVTTANRGRDLADRAAIDADAVAIRDAVAAANALDVRKAEAQERQHDLAAIVREGLRLRRRMLREAERARDRKARGEPPPRPPIRDVPCYSSRGKSAKFIGVYRLGHERGWIGVIVDRKGPKLKLGPFATAEEAASARDARLREVGPGASRLNFPDAPAPVPVPSEPRRPHGGYAGVSGYLGVAPNKGGKSYFVQVAHGGKVHYFGSYPTAEEAARVYDAKVRELKGSTGRTNFPEVPPCS